GRDVRPTGCSTSAASIRIRLCSTCQRITPCSARAVSLARAARGRAHAAAAVRTREGPLRKLLFSLHLYTALIAGVFIMILGVTGGIMAFEPEIERLA